MKRHFTLFLILALVICKTQFTFAGDGPNDDWMEILPTVKPAVRGYSDIAALGNGMALLFSGSNNSHSGNTDSLTWVYDTKTDTWTDMNPAGPVPATRYKHSMAYAGNNKVVLFGGSSDGGIYHKDTWVYDYSENKWTESTTPDELWERQYPAMAYIGDNKVLLFGGRDESGKMDDTWLYDATTDTWEKLAPTTSPTARQTEMSYIGDDKVLIYCTGIDGEKDTWVFDLSDNTWTNMLPTTNPSSRTGQGMAYLGDGNVILYGGFSDAYAAHSDTWIYNLENNTWTEETPETTPPTGNKITLMCETSMDGSSYIVAFGGKGGDSKALDETFEFGGTDWSLDAVPPISDENDDWKEIFPTVKPAVRGYSDIAALGNGMALLFSGSNNSHSGNTDSLTWVYDTKTDTWTDMNPAGPVPATRYKHSMAYAGNNKVVLFGGSSDGGIYHKDTWVYDYSENKWTESTTPDELWERQYPAMAYIGDNKVLLFGGRDESGKMDDTWLYDATKDTWEKLAPTTSPTARQTEMSYIGDDKVLIYCTGIDGEKDTWVFDLSDNTWTNMLPATNPSSRTGQGMAYLGDGNVILYGGFSDAYAAHSDTWIYNLENNTWTEETPETTPPTGNKITLMCETSMDGSSYIVAFGGKGGDSKALDETFEFGGNDWSLDYVSSSSENPMDLIEFNVFPNPVKDILKVSFVGKMNNIKIYNLSGVEVFSKQVKYDRDRNIDVSSLTQGVYIIKVTSEGAQSTKKFIKN